MSERAAPFYCPYCGDEDLRPSEDGGHGAWECTSCARAFKLQFLGLLAGSAVLRTDGRAATAGGRQPAGQEHASAGRPSVEAPGRNGTGAARPEKS